MESEVAHVVTVQGLCVQDNLNELEIVNSEPEEFLVSLGCIR